MSAAPSHLPSILRPDLGAVAQPLDLFYAKARQPLPPFEVLDGEEVPEPARSLLVHYNDMTPTLEAFYGEQIALRVLGRRRRGNEYSREVALFLKDSKRPVEFGANRIQLDRFPPAARQLILQEREPLGYILRDFNITHTCQPNAFLRLASDRLINSVLGLQGAQTLYGRHNQLFDPEGRLISEVVEILRDPNPTTPQQAKCADFPP
jgi:chorismate-pyruvate lyase